MDLGITTRPLLYAVGLIVALFVLARSPSRTTRHLALLAISYALYLTWGPWFVLVLLASTVMNFVIGRRMQRRPTVGWLWTGLIFNLLLLGFFKYLPGASASVPFASLQTLLPSGSSARHLLLDLPGDELPARPLPRRGTRSDIHRVRALHGVLPGRNLRSDMPAARYAAAVPLRSASIGRR